MSIESQLEREEEILNKMLEDGEISIAEFNKQIYELHREFREMAMESAQEAYEQELSRWY